MIGKRSNSKISVIEMKKLGSTNSTKGLSVLRYLNTSLSFTSVSPSTSYTSNSVQGRAQLPYWVIYSIRSLYSFDFLRSKYFCFFCAYIRSGFIGGLEYPVVKCITFGMDTKFKEGVKQVSNPILKFLNGYGNKTNRSKTSGKSD